MGLDFGPPSTAPVIPSMHCERELVTSFVARPLEMRNTNLASAGGKLTAEEDGGSLDHVRASKSCRTRNHHRHISCAFSKKPNGRLQKRIGNSFASLYEGYP